MSLARNPANSRRRVGRIQCLGQRRNCRHAQTPRSDRFDEKGERKDVKETAGDCVCGVWIGIRGRRRTNKLRLRRKLRASNEAMGRPMALALLGVRRETAGDPLAAFGRTIRGQPSNARPPPQTLPWKLFPSGNDEGRTRTNSLRLRRRAECADEGHEKMVRGAIVRATSNGRRFRLQRLEERFEDEGGGRGRIS